ncbi:MAG TPA: glycosyltransferase family 4 protein, partial [Pyrinomonadaceae bacterium]
MEGLKVLIANATMASLTGTETYVRDLALGLLRKGHTPVVYAPELGELALQLRAATVPVVDNLSAVGFTPDIIHGNHNTEMMTALLHFPGVPAVFFCHSWTDWVSSPPSHPRVLAYVAVDDTCRDRLLCEHGIPEERLRVMLHAADLERFRPREPLPPRPRRALVFSNNANKWTHLAAVREACSRAGIELDVVGAGVDAQTSSPESILGNYDLVFAKARCAQEALAVGAAVILCDARGSGPLVTASELERLRRLNFGIRALGEKIDPDLLLRQIERYDAADAAEASRRFRAGSDLGSVVEDALALYGDVVTEHKRLPAADPLEETRAAADYMRWLTLTTRRKQAECESMLANSLTLRLRNRVG